MVWDGTGPDLTGSGPIYGLFFGRAIGPTNANGTEVSGGVLTASAGGDASFIMHSNGTLYGSIVLMGTTGNLNGTSAVVYDKDILTNLANEGSFQRFGGIPGSWSDRSSY
jgi:hypothetical protein